MLHCIQQAIGDDLDPILSPAKVIDCLIILHQTLPCLLPPLPVCSQNGTVALTGGVAQPPPPEPKPEPGLTRRLSEHDRVNNTNALELLQTGSFKLVPGKDTVPYEKLMGLRLEDGIDVTRKVRPGPPRGRCGLLPWASPRLHVGIASLSQLVTACHLCPWQVE